MGVAASLPALAGTVGCIFGGWISDRLFRDNRRLPVVVAPVLSALFLYLTLTTTSVTMVMIYQTISGLLLNIFFAAFWALPISAVPKERMGITSGVINTGGQLAGATSPIVVGALVSASGGRFGLTFGVLVICLILVGVIALTLPGRARPKPGEVLAR
jgi:MFS family permease